MKQLLIAAALTLFVFCEARPGVVTPKPVEIESSVGAEEKHVRVRKHSDYKDYMSQSTVQEDEYTGTNYNVFNIGNGYKNTNTVTVILREGKTFHFDRYNIGNGFGNKNTIEVILKPRRTKLNKE